MCRLPVLCLLALLVATAATAAVLDYAQGVETADYAEESVAEEPLAVELRAGREEYEEADEQEESELRAGSEDQQQQQQQGEEDQQRDKPAQRDEPWEKQQRAGKPDRLQEQTQQTQQTQRTLDRLQEKQNEKAGEQQDEQQGEQKPGAVEGTIERVPKAGEQQQGEQKDRPSQPFKPTVHTAAGRSGATGTGSYAFVSPYGHFKAVSSPRTWAEALAACAADGATLALPSSEAEARAVGQLYAKIKGKVSGSKDRDLFFIGASDMAKEGVFVTVLGTTFGSNQYFRWQKGEPNNHNKKEHCVLSNDQGVYWDGNCDKRFAFVCKLKEPCPVGPIQPFGNHQTTTSQNNWQTHQQPNQNPWQTQQQPNQNNWQTHQQTNQQPNQQKPWETNQQSNQQNSWQTNQQPNQQNSWQTNQQPNQQNSWQTNQQRNQPFG